MIPLLAQMASATFGVNWVEPTGNKLSGEVLLNVTVPENIGVKNCTFTAEADDVNQNVPLFLGFDTKPQPLGTDTDFNLTLDTEDLEDSTWSITVACYSPDDWGATVFSDITIDNTIPEKPYNLSPSSGSIVTSTEVEFMARVKSKKTTHCILDFYGNHPGTTRYVTDPEMNGECRIKLNVSASSYEWTMTATDGLNKMISDKQDLWVEIKNPDTKTNAFTEIKKQKEDAYKAVQNVVNRQDIAEKIFGLIIAAGIIFFVFKLKRT